MLKFAPTLPPLPFPPHDPFAGRQLDLFETLDIEHPDLNEYIDRMRELENEYYEDDDDAPFLGI